MGVGPEKDSRRTLDVNLELEHLKKCASITRMGAFPGDWLLYCTPRPPVVTSSVKISRNGRISKSVRLRKENNMGSANTVSFKSTSIPEFTNAAWNLSTALAPSHRNGTGDKEADKSMTDIFASDCDNRAGAGSPEKGSEKALITLVVSPSSRKTCDSAISIGEAAPRPSESVALAVSNEARSKERGCVGKKRKKNKSLHGKRSNDELGKVNLDNLWNNKKKNKRPSCNGTRPPYGLFQDEDALVVTCPAHSSTKGASATGEIQSPSVTIIMSNIESAMPTKAAASVCTMPVCVQASAVGSSLASCSHTSNDDGPRSSARTKGKKLRGKSIPVVVTHTLPPLCDACANVESCPGTGGVHSSCMVSCTSSPQCSHKTTHQVNRDDKESEQPLGYTETLQGTPAATPHPLLAEVTDVQTTRWAEYFECAKSASPRIFECEHEAERNIRKKEEVASKEDFRPTERSQRTKRAGDEKGVSETNRTGEGKSADETAVSDFKNADQVMCKDVSRSSSETSETSDQAVMECPVVRVRPQVSAPEGPTAVSNVMLQHKRAPQKCCTAM
uniref:Uncharacterized protein n=1 Tax=Trypanosoma vivax (strain Y486) TaxID=1055687 RepID=G0U029_TRYVY|nr:hypothetical protein TVY486_0800340 [Trypanosoma vivax Y486]